MILSAVGGERDSLVLPEKTLVLSCQGRGQGTSGLRVGVLSQERRHSSGCKLNRLQQTYFLFLLVASVIITGANNGKADCPLVVMLMTSPARILLNLDSSIKNILLFSHFTDNETGAWREISRYFKITQGMAFPLWLSRLRT